ncbi:MAG TPA: hypothetical protein VN495_02910, partial [Candidatus Paceibacterota bacterium]|nr:hypothetical protein [Candidatus Paceibacterota bacterium]
MVWFGHVFRGEIQSFDISTAAKEKPTMVGRLIGTICALFAYGVVMMIYTPQAALVTSKVAGRQFETSSDAAYLQATYVSSFFSTVTVLLSVVLLVVLILIWAKPIAKAAGWVKDNAGQLVIAIAAGGALLFGTLAPSYAFFEKVD